MTWKLSLLTAASIALAIGTARGQSNDDTPVKVGVLTDMSGLYSDIGGKGSVEAARMAIEDFGGKLLGKPIELVYADHQNKPDIGAGIARKWYTTDGVDVIVDVPTSSVALAVQGVSKDVHKIVLFSGAGASDITGKSCSPVLGALDIRYLCAGARHWRHNGETGRQDVVFHHRRLRLRS